MPRYFVYVNTNSDRKHIEIHGETKRRCGHISKMIKKGGPCEGKFEIEVLEDGTIKIGEGENGYWLVVWGNSLDQVEKDNESLKKASKDVDKKPKTCPTCMY